MKTAELTGAQLDYWVAKAEGYGAEVMKDEKGEFVVRTEKFDNGGHARGAFFPSTLWHEGGPIIEREHIDTISNGPAEWAAGYSLETWKVEMRIGYFGATPLVAAMRAYVASKFGDEVSA